MFRYAIGRSGESGFFRPPPCTQMQGKPREAPLQVRLDSNHCIPSRTETPRLSAWQVAYSVPRWNWRRFVGAHVPFCLAPFGAVTAKREAAPIKSSSAAWDPRRGQPLALLQQGSAMSCSSMDKFEPGTILSPAFATPGGRRRVAFCRFLQVVYRLISIPGETAQTDRMPKVSDLRKRRPGSSPGVPKPPGWKMSGTQLVKTCRNARRVCPSPTRQGGKGGVAHNAKTSADRK